MAVLVTGGAGYIGSHMVYELIDNGYSVVVVDDLSTGQDWVLPSNVPLFIGKTGDSNLISSIIRAYDVKTIFHFAAAIVVNESVANPLQYYSNNTAQSCSLFETAVKSGIENIIFSSTAAVYGNPTTVPIKETATLLPLSPYGSSKLMTETMLRDVDSAHGLRHVSLRYFNVAGADPEGRTGQSGTIATHLIKIASQVALGVRPMLSIFGDDYATPDGTCIRDYVHVSDLVDAHMKAFRYLENGGSSIAMNVGYGKGFSVKDVIKSVKRVSKIDIPVTISSRRPGDPDALVASNELISSKLKWKPKYNDLDLIVDHALTWEKRLAQHDKASDRISDHALRLASRLSAANSNMYSTGDSVLKQLR